MLHFILPLAYSLIFHFLILRVVVPGTRNGAETCPLLLKGELPNLRAGFGKGAVATLMPFECFPSRFTPLTDIACDGQHRYVLFMESRIEKGFQLTGRVSVRDSSRDVFLQ